MKTFFLSLAAAGLMATTGYAQTQPTLQNLSLPSSPGFMLVDLAPAVVESPATPRELVVGALQSIDAQSSWPQNYAVETAPYWWKGISRSAYDVIGLDKQGQARPFSGLLFTSLSAAFITRDMIPDGSTAQQKVFSAGLRTRLLTFRSRDQKDRIHAGVREWMDQAASDLSDTSALLQAVPLSPADLQAIVNQKAARDRQSGSVVQRLGQTLSEKPLFTLDLAGAYGLYGIGDTSWQTGRYGAWLTAGLNLPIFRSTDDNQKGQPTQSYLSVLGLGRYLYDNYAAAAAGGAPVQSGIVDAGGRALLQVRRFSVGVEALVRGYTGDGAATGTTHRVVGTVAYQISNTLYLNGAFGRNFDNPDKLVSLFGISFGFGENRITLPGDQTASATGSGAN